MEEATSVVAEGGAVGGAEEGMAGSNSWAPSGGISSPVLPNNRGGEWWRPTLEKSNPTRECIRRVRNDVRCLARDPIPGIFACPHEDLTTVVHGLVVGPADTPYEGGFFYFVIHCPDDYPHSPPQVRLMTTGGGMVRFNPNLYQNGKVCLSILGTWSGPGWTPANSIGSVLLCIQSLMNDRPYYNEPGYEEGADPQDVKDYSDCIQHETLRVAVCSMAAADSSLAKSIPGCLRHMVKALFDSFIIHYQDVCEQNMHRDGQQMRDPFRTNRGVFKFGAILRKINDITKEGDGDDVKEGETKG